MKTFHLMNQDQEKTWYRNCTICRQYYYANKATPVELYYTSTNEFSKLLLDDNCRKQDFQVYLDGQQTSCLNKSKYMNIPCEIHVFPSCLLLLAE